MLDREGIAEETSTFGEVVPSDELSKYLNVLTEVRILRVLDEGEQQLYELRHDALAATISEWITELEKELIEVRDNVMNRFNEYQARNQSQMALLDHGFMEYLRPYRSRLDALLGDVTREYLRLSDRALTRKKRLRQFAVTGGLFGSLLIIFAFLFYLERQKTIAATTRFQVARKGDR